jgi:hypothetical protein
MAGALGRRVPQDFEHVAKYPLTATTAPSAPVPVSIGVSWYSAFDSPRKDSSGRYWIARDNNLGRVRGGHCVCLKPRGVVDPVSFWEYYDQGSEGACVGFGSSRMMSLLNRKRYDARWLYREAQLVDQWGDTPPEEGTSVRAGMDILRKRGHRVTRGKASGPVTLSEGIAANRWATNIDQVLDALGYTGLDFCDILNSWGRDGYPHLVRIPATVLERLLFEDGEFTLISDR